MNAREALETLQKTHQWLSNIQDYDDHTCIAQGEVRPEGTSFTLNFTAISELEKCVEICEALVAAAKVLSEEPIPLAILQVILQARKAPGLAE